MIDEHKRAIEYDLIQLGLRLRHLGTEELTWGDLLAIVQWAPRSSALYREMYPDDAEWDSLNTQLIAEIADSLRVANWQRGEGKKADYPTPYPRPGVPVDDTHDPEKGTAVVEPVTQEEMDNWLGW